MGNQQAKFCLDRNSVRWILLEGVITRTTQKDDPTAGQTLQVGRIASIEQRKIERTRRSPLAKPAVYLGLLLLGVFGWLATGNPLAAAPALALGAIVLLWGLLRMRGQKETMDSFQLVVPGTNPQDWVIVGSHNEVLGFIDGVKSDMQELKQGNAATR